VEINETEAKSRRKKRNSRGALDETPLNVSPHSPSIIEDTKLKNKKQKKKGKKEKENSK
jgi:hypothetical protein